MKYITRKEYPFPINWILNLRFNYRLKQGKPAHVTYKGKFYAYSGIIHFPQQRIYFKGDKTL